jgi:hypothetical protein
MHVVRAFVTVAGEESRLHCAQDYMHASDGLSDDLQQAESSGRTESTFRACRSQSSHRPAATALTT